MGVSGQKVKPVYSHLGSAVKSIVSQRFGPSPPIASAISRRIASAFPTLSIGDCGGTAMWISMNWARPTFAT